MKGQNTNRNFPLIALLTDFGWDDYFVGVLKGVIASLNPQATVVDISHGIESFQIHKGAFQLWAAYRFFPRGTVFLSVVDPGVGSSRRIILARTRKYFFVSPDNGLLTYVLATEGYYELYEARNSKYFLTALSSTFEARDKMAPVAAWLTLGVAPEEMGPRIKDFQRLPFQLPVKTERGYVGQVVYIDKFGNGITNLQGKLLSEKARRKSPLSFSLEIKNRKITQFYSSYAEAPSKDVFFLIGSLGMIEIAVKEGSAAAKLDFQVGESVTLILGNG